MSQFHAFSVDGFPLTETDEFGCRWTVEGIDGWYTGGGVRLGTQARTQQNGDWRGVSTRSGRILTLRGKVFCPSETAVELAARRLSSILGHGGFGELVGESAAGTLSSSVQLEDVPLFEERADYALWQLTVGSEDHLLYGPPTIQVASLADSAGGTGLVYPLAYPLDYGLAPGVTPGALTVPNAGTASYYPRLRIDGPVTNPVVTLVETGDWVRYNGTVPAGQHLDINWGNPRRVTIGSAEKPPSMKHLVKSSGNWLAVPIGGGSMTFSADTADPDSSLTVWGYEGAWL